PGLPILRDRSSRIFKDGSGRFHDLILALPLEQVDRSHVPEKRALLDQPEPSAARVADDLEDVGDTLDGPAVHELFERKGVLARAHEQGDDLITPLPVVERRAGNAAIAERARSSDRPGPFLERTLDRIGGEPAAAFLNIDQLAKAA